MDLSIQLGALTLPNPLIAASGCFGYGLEYSDVVDLSTLGGVAVKGLFLAEREGHPPQRIVETPAGMLNAIGLQGIGVHRFVRERLPELRDRRAIVFVNICGTTIDEYVELARILSDADGVAALELNISCPNVKSGLIVGDSPDETESLLGAVRSLTSKPLIVKLSPNAPPAAVAGAAERGGADAVSLINTLRATGADPAGAGTWLGAGSGGLSGAAVRPVALLQVREVADAVSIPVVGMGGVSSGRHAADLIRAGATAVAVGTESFRDPRAGLRVATELAAELRAAKPA